ncbi:MAG: penicillin-binding transpeptidase domain-containing protein [Dermatophilaceae bacterium]
MNAPIRRLSLLAALLFLSLLLSSTWIQYVDAKGINAISTNRRTQLFNYTQQRGAMIVAGDTIASSKPASDEFKWTRVYAEGKRYAHVTGFYSFSIPPDRGLEYAENDLLSGRSDKLFYRRVSDLLTGRRPAGASLELTLDPRAQEAADTALGSQRGAVVALDPSTGAILAMVSHPAYDPNLLTTHDSQTAGEAWTALLKADGSPLTNRAIAGNLYPPGSTFKLITAAAALESGDYTKDSEVPGPAALELPGVTQPLANHDHQPCGPNAKTTLDHALTISCNTAFASLGMTLGADKLRAQAAKFGFGQSLHIPMPATPSTIPAQLNAPQTAQSAIGQYEVKATPLQMAMVAAAIGNGGKVMTPYLVQRVVSSDLQTIEGPQQHDLGDAISPGTAEQLTQMMTDVVAEGTGTPAQIPGVQVAGKTGTAQHGEGAAPHAWFTGFAPASSPKVAVAVVVEDGGQAGSEAAGGTVAGPIAKAVMEAVLNS